MHKLNIPNTNNQRKTLFDSSNLYDLPLLMWTQCACPLKMGGLICFIMKPFLTLKTKDVPPETKDIVIYF